MQAWERIEPTTVAKVGYRHVVSKTFVLPDGQHDTFDVMDREGATYAGCIALTPDNQVIIARQFRPGPEQVMEEIPGGAVDVGEDPQVAAERELLEETGYRAGNMEPLGKVYKDAYNNATWYYFLATGCELTTEGQQLEHNEFADVALISIEQLLDNAREARMTDIEAVFLAYDELKSRLDDLL